MTEMFGGVQEEIEDVRRQLAERSAAHDEETRERGTERQREEARSAAHDRYELAPARETDLKQEEERVKQLDRGQERLRQTLREKNSRKQRTRLWRPRSR